MPESSLVASRIILLHAPTQLIVGEQCTRLFPSGSIQIDTPLLWTAGREKNQMVNEEIANDDVAPSDFESGMSERLCERCATGTLRAERIATALQGANGLVVVVNIPAVVCSDCGEEFVGRVIAQDLKQLASDGRAPEIVSVFDYLRGLAGN